MNLSDIILMRVCTKKMKSLSSSAKCLGAWRTLSLLYESGLLVAKPFKSQVHVYNILKYQEWSYPQRQEPDSEYPDILLGECKQYPKRPVNSGKHSNYSTLYINACIGYVNIDISPVYIDLRNIPIEYFQEIKESEMKQIAHQCIEFGILTPLSPLEYEYLASSGVIVPYIPVKNVDNKYEKSRDGCKMSEKSMEYSVTVSLKKDDSKEALKVTTGNFDPLAESKKIRQQEPLSFREQLMLENKLTK